MESEPGSPTSVSSTWTSSASSAGKAVAGEPAAIAEEVQNSSDDEEKTRLDDEVDDDDDLPDEGWPPTVTATQFLQQFTPPASDIESAPSQTDGVGANVKSDEEIEAGMAKMPMLHRVIFSEEEEVPEEDLIAAFKELDVDGGGEIDMSELVDGLQCVGLAVSPMAAVQVMKEIDTNLSGDIDINEFIDFFRHMEELRRWKKKKASRTMLFAALFDLTFLTVSTAVCVILMIQSKAPESERKTVEYKQQQTILVVLLIIFGLMFVYRILVPLFKYACLWKIMRLHDRWKARRKEGFGRRLSARLFGREKKDESVYEINQYQVAQAVMLNKSMAKSFNAAAVPELHIAKEVQLQRLQQQPMARAVMKAQLQHHSLPGCLPARAEEDMYDAALQKEQMQLQSQQSLQLQMMQMQQLQMQPMQSEAFLQQQQQLLQMQSQQLQPMQPQPMQPQQFQQQQQQPLQMQAM